MSRVTGVNKCVTTTYPRMQIGISHVDLSFIAPLNNYVDIFAFIWSTAFRGLLWREVLVNTRRTWLCSITSSFLICKNPLSWILTRDYIQCDITAYHIAFLFFKFHVRRFKSRMSETGRARGYSNLPEIETKVQEAESETPAISYGEPYANQVTNTSRLKRILRWRKYLILVLTPILLMPIPIAIPGKVSSLLLLVSNARANG